jgi:GWxTD domain-containing protein
VFTRNLIRVSIFVGLVFLVPQALAQKPSPASDLQDKPRKVRQEPDRSFTDWIRDVEPIITAEEFNAWKKLRTNEEREQFIGEFWRRRDPDPDTEENEYREAYYERVAYVNEHFSSGIPGYKTDRGRIYLKYGKPDEVESHPAGGAYTLASYEGNGSTSTYPFETWWYRNLPGRSDVEVEFVDPTGTGEYRIARNPFEKIAVLTVPGGAPTFEGVSQASVLAAANGWGNPFSPRAKDGAFEWMDRIRLRDEAPPVNFDSPLGPRVPTPMVEDNFLTSAIQISYFKQSDERVIVAFTIQTDNRDLVFRDIGGIQTARLNIAGRITSVAERRVGFFEDAVSTTTTQAELIETKERKSAYQKAVTLPPGRYKVDVLVRDIESGAESRQHVGFQVPKFGVNLSSSSLILASVLEQVSDVPAPRQFMIGDQKVIPNISGAFHRGAPVGVYLQIYNAGIDQTTLRPAIDVEYALMKDGKELSMQNEDWRGSHAAGERLTLSRLIDSRGLAPGDYHVEVRVKDHVSGQALVQSAKFTIVP